MVSKQIVLFLFLFTLIFAYPVDNIMIKNMQVKVDEKIRDAQTTSGIVDYENREISLERWSTSNQRIEPSIKLPQPDIIYTFEDDTVGYWPILNWKRQKVGYHGLAYEADGEFRIKIKEGLLLNEFTVIVFFNIEDVGVDRLSILHKTRGIFGIPGRYSGSLLWDWVDIGISNYSDVSSSTIGIWIRYEVITDSANPDTYNTSSTEKIQEGFPIDDAGWHWAGIVFKVGAESYFILDGEILYSFTPQYPFRVVSHDDYFNDGFIRFHNWDYRFYDPIDTFLMYYSYLDIGTINQITNTIFCWYPSSSKEYFRGEFNITSAYLSAAQYYWAAIDREEDTITPQNGTWYATGSPYGIMAFSTSYWFGAILEWENVIPGLFLRAEIDVENILYYHYTGIDSREVRVYAWDGTDWILIGSSSSRATFIISSLEQYVVNGILKVKISGLVDSYVQTWPNDYQEIMWIYRAELVGSGEIESSFKADNYTIMFLSNEPTDIHIITPSVGYVVDFEAYYTIASINNLALNYTFSPYYVITSNPARLMDQEEEITLPIRSYGGVSIKFTGIIVILRGIWNVSQLIHMVDDPHTIMHVDPLGRISGINTSRVLTRDIYLINDANSYQYIELASRNNNSFTIAIPPHTSRRLSMLVSEVKINGEWIYLNIDYSVYIQPKPMAKIKIALFNIYSGLGVPEEMFKVFINGTRISSPLEYNAPIGSVLNITIMDFWNRVIYQANYTVNDSVEFIDIGLELGTLAIYNEMDEDIKLNISCLNASHEIILQLVIFRHTGVQLQMPAGVYNITFISGNETVRIRSMLVQVTIKGEQLEVSPSKIIIKERMFNEEKTILGIPISQIRFWAAYAIFVSLIGIIIREAYVEWKKKQLEKEMRRKRDIEIIYM